MSYISWREDREKEVKAIVDDGAIETLPGWTYIAVNNDITDKVVTPIIDHILEDDWDPITVACVFAEYLYERYHIDPIDVEVLTQMIIKSYLRKSEEHIQMGVDAGIQAALEEYSKGEDNE